MLGVPGVAGSRGDHAECELVGVCLAHHDRAGVLQAADDRGVLRGNVVLSRLRARSSGDAGSLDKIFHPDREAVQWAAVVARCNLLLSAFRRLPRMFGGHRGERVDRGIHVLDALEYRIDELDGGEVS